MADYFADISSYQRSDLSFFQGLVNAGVSSVFIKTTQGSAAGSNYLNNKSLDQTRNALKAGMNVGFYHYFLATSNSDSIAEAQFFIQSVINLGFGKNTPLAVDVEDDKRLDKRNVSSYVDTFINYLAEQGYTNIVQYSTASWFNNGILDPSKYPTWVAHVYSSSVGVVGNVIAWQYTWKWGGTDQDMSYDWGIFNKKTPTEPQNTHVEPVKPKVENIIKLNADIQPVDSLGIERPEKYSKDSTWKAAGISLINNEPHYKIATNIYVPISKTAFNNVVIVKYLDDHPAPLFDDRGNRVVNPDVTIGKAFKYSAIKIINSIPMAKIATNEYLPLQYTSGSNFK